MEIEKVFFAILSGHVVYVVLDSGFLRPYADHINKRSTIAIRKKGGTGELFLFSFCDISAVLL
mgnify:CR=1 FL=1